ncbi:hypothetical protein SFRURICE_009067 [Spodoptera frugiperda]|nr:hypothetical protein SFRURICE_009067 [Spodoptera frugiperda]
MNVMFARHEVKFVFIVLFFYHFTHCNRKFAGRKWRVCRFQEQHRALYSSYKGFCKPSIFRNEDHDDNPCPGKSKANIGLSLMIIGISGSQVPALSCHPCNASIGRWSPLPHSFPAICPYCTVSI